MILAQCPVCHEPFTTCSDCILSALPCGHVFHKHCITQWIATSPTCPQCRVRVDPNRLIVRIFFDVVALSPMRPSSSSAKSLDSFEDAKAELDRILEVNAQLTYALNDCRSKCEHFGERVIVLRRNIESITAQWLKYGYQIKIAKENGERLKIEVERLRKLLSDTEAESGRLRIEMYNMKCIKKLISASADDAQDILRRYSVQREAILASCTDTTANGRIESVDGQSQSSAATLYNLESLSRWTAALRGELTASREKALRYREEASRLRERHAEALQRSRKAERNLKECDRELEAANDMVRSLMGILSLYQHGGGGGERGVVDPKADTATERKAPEQGESTTNRSLVGALVSPPLKHQLRTPAGNPFAAPQYPSMQRASSSDQLVKKSTPPVKPIAQPSVITFANRCGNPPTRRSSRIFQMSILRRQLRQSVQAVSTSIPTVSSLPDMNQDWGITDISPTVGHFAGSKNTAVSKMKRNRSVDHNKSNKPGHKSSRVRFLTGL